MSETILDIYVQKKALLKSVTIYLLSLTIWGLILGFTLKPKNSSFHPEVGPIIYVPLIIGFILVVFVWVGNVVANLWRCAIELLEAPKLVYSVWIGGLIDHRSGRKFKWHELEPFHRSALGNDIVVPILGKKTSLLLAPRGLTHADFNKMRMRIILYAPRELTENIRQH